MEKHGQLALVTRADRTPLFTIAGQPYVRLATGDDDGDILPGDVNGDGWPELIVEMETVTDQVKAYTKMGGPVAHWELEGKLSSAVCGDTNGNGKDELLNIEFGRLACYEIDAERREIKGWPRGYFPSACRDLNGDGCDEVLALHTKMITPDYYDPITRQFKGLPEGAGKKEFMRWVRDNAAPQGGIFDPKTGKFTEFEVPAGVDWRMNIFTGERGELACADIDRDGALDIAAKAAVGTALLVFGRTGKLKYYEEFGAPALYFGVAHAGKKSHLVVELDKKLLAWP